MSLYKITRKKLEQERRKKMINVINSLMPVICLIMGFYFGFRIGKDKEIPKVEIKTPVEVVEEHKEKKENRKRKQQEQEEQKELQDYLKRIDEY